MGLKSLFGYIIAFGGLALIAFIVKPLNQTAIAKQISALTGGFGSVVFIAVGAVLIVVGVIMIKSSGGKQPKEVPIFQGKNVVGFRILGKK